MQDSSINKIIGQVKDSLSSLLDDNKSAIIADLERSIRSQGGTGKFPVSVGVKLVIAPAKIGVNAKVSWGVRKSVEDAVVISTEPDMFEEKGKAK